MFASIRRHQKWLWVVISTLTIISFVAFFSPSSQSGAGRGGLGGDETVGSIYGRDITRDRYLETVREAELNFFINYRYWADQDPRIKQMGLIERETHNRVLMIEKLSQFSVQTDLTAVARWIAEASLFQDQSTKAFNKDYFDRFVGQMLPGRGLTRRDFERYVEHEVGIQHLISILGLTGRLVTPQEAEATYRRENEQVDTKVILFNAADYVEKVNIDPAALATFYTNRQANYRIAERAQVSMVKFDITNFFAAAEVQMAKDTNRLNQTINTVYEQRGASFYKGPTGEPLSPDQAKEKIREEARRETAQVEAQKKANAFIEQLLNLAPVTPDNFDKLAAASGLVTSVTVPFTQAEPPAELNLPADFGRQAFRLTQEEPFLDQPIVGDSAIYAIGYKSRIPSTLPPLEQVADRVTTDYKKNQSTVLCNAAGSELARTLSSAIAQGKTFEAAAAEAKSEIIDLPPFSQKTQTLTELRTRSNDLGAIKNVAFTLTPGKMSGYGSTSDGGFVIFLEKRVQVTDDQTKTGLVDQLRTMRQSRQNEAFTEWLRKEMELAKIVLPGDQKVTSAK
ncbi:MAG: hypothetical protein EXS31_09435 [Pedosphaera sp.]|nr:hypothetical protein [Pedosphaera sp.]